MNPAEMADPWILLPAAVILWSILGVLFTQSVRKELKRGKND